MKITIYGFHFITVTREVNNINRSIQSRESRNITSEDLAERLQTLNEIGITLTAERDVESVLERILKEAIRFTSAEGGSIYIREGSQLRFAISSNKVLSERSGDGDEVSKFTDKLIPLSNESIAGYVASSGKLLNIKDAYNIPDHTPYEFDSSFDRKNNYKTQSMLAVPMVDPEGDVLGVIALINARNDQGEVVPFPEKTNQLIRSLASQAAVSLQNATFHEKLKTAYLETIHRLSVAAEFKDRHTAVHIKRMSKYSAEIAREASCTEEFVEDLLYASAMHDIGKIAISEGILLKDGDLTEDEWDEMKRHTVIGHNILKDSESDIMQLSAEIALTHHEKWNGTGYPQGLSGTDIPLSGRIVALADVFDALTSERPYKDPFSVEKSVNIIKEDAGSHFDPELVEHFLSCLDSILEIKENHQDDKNPRSWNLTNLSNNLLKDLAK